MNHTSTILVVDDDAGIRDMFRALLESEGFVVAFAENGEVALDLAPRVDPDVILLDVMMPGIQGYEVCRRLREDERLKDVPIVMLTALAHREARIEGLDAGADDFITKPFDSLELIARIRTTTRLNRYRRLVAERAKVEWIVASAETAFLLLAEDHTVAYANERARQYLNLPSGAAPRFVDAAQESYRCEPADAWERWPEVDDAGPRYLVRPETPTANACWLTVETMPIPPTIGGGRLVSLRDVTVEVTRATEVRRFHLTVQHKLRTPMTLVRGSLELLRDDASLPEEVAQIVELAGKGADRLYGEIEDVLDFLRAPAAAEPGEGFAPSALEPLARAIAAEVGIERIDVRVTPETAAVRLAISERGVESILREVLENSRKFHPAGAPHVVIEADLADDGRAVIRATDNGVSLSPEQLAHALVPYYQGDKFRTGQASGMGLGLALVASVVWGVGGRCRVANRADGPGVVVEVVVPATRVGVQ